MRTDIKIYAILFLLLMNNILLAQEKRSIEVVAADTINLKALKFTYLIEVSESFNSKISNYNFYGDKDSIDTTKTLVTNELLTLLKQNKFNCEITSKNGFEVSNFYKSSDYINVTMDSISELQRLYKLIQPLKGIKGEFSNIEYESIASYTTEIYQSLYNDALIKATILSKVSGGTLGQLLTVEAVNSVFGDFSELYDGLMQKLKLSMSFEKLDKMVITKMVFRFELK